ncbi:MAG: Hpt domain-containing protein [Betaproteobacteria bacterium]|nr:Hpt domain-containing protein [Betaproteobacteria bacterium]
MNASIGPLSWVKSEIDRSMGRALSALRAYAAESGQGANIGLARAQLHQVHGALSIVGLDGLARVAQELEALLADMEHDALGRTREIVALAARAFEALGAYLDALASGSDNRPLRLYPIYSELVQARGNGAADPVDLYFPDVSFRPPDRDGSPVVLGAEDEARYFHDQRARFQRGMVQWLRQDSLGAGEMRAAVEAIEAAQGTMGQRAFWWAALAFFDALERNALPPEVDSKRMCSRIEQQIRRRQEGLQNIAGRLLREVLYCVALARPESEHLRLVQETCALRQTLPEKASAAAMPAAGPAAPKTAREALDEAKANWNQFASGNAQSLPAFQTAATALRDASAALGNADLTALTREIARLANWLASNPRSMSEAISLEVTTALLLLEKAIGNLAVLGAEFAEQSRFVCGRIQACVQGNLLRTAPPIPLLDEMSRTAQERLVTDQLVAEMRANLGRIEQVLDAFFRDGSRRTDLEALERPLNQLKGALQMLGEARARDALEDCDAQIRHVAQPSYSPRQDEFERIAQILSGLGFYIESLAWGEADFDETMRPIATSGLEKAAANEQAMTVEAEVQQQRRETEKLYDQWKRTPADISLKSELQKNLAAIRKSAGLIADAALESKAQQALRALEDEQASSLAPAIAEAIEKIAPAGAVQGPSARTAKLIDAGTEAIEAELLAVYLEEADEVLATIRCHLETMAANPDDREALTVIRRGFHTLRGGSLTVGLTRLGEAVWAAEKTLNLWLEERRAVTGDLLRLIDAAREYFCENVARLKSGVAATDGRELIEQAERTAAGTILVAPDRVTAVETAGEQALPPESEFVVIGEHQVARTVFQAFSKAAKGLLATLAAEREILLTHGVITDAMMRATHELAEICATVGAEAARELGRALERALQALGATALSESEESLIVQTIDALGETVNTIETLRRPTPRADLTDLLGRIGSPLEPAPAPPAALEVRTDAVDRRVNETGEGAIASSRIDGEMRALRAGTQELSCNAVRLHARLREIEIQAESQMHSRSKDAQAVGQGEESDPLVRDRFTRLQELSRLMAESIADLQAADQNLIDALQRIDAVLAVQAQLNHDPR